MIQVFVLLAALPRYQTLPVYRGKFLFGLGRQGARYRVFCLLFVLIFPPKKAEVIFSHFICSLRILDNVYLLLLFICVRHSRSHCVAMADSEVC